MIALTQRQKLFGGALGVACVVWCIDMLTGRTNPNSADASPTAVLPAEEIAIPADPPDLPQLIASLSGGKRVHTSLPLEQTKRNLFVPTGSMQVAISPPAAVQPEPSDKPEKRPLGFEDRHTLQGVLTGRVPLALIDGVLLPKGAEIDGYRLVQIDRDFVLLEGEQGRVKLLLLPGQQAPSPQP